MILLISWGQTKYIILTLEYILVWLYTCDFAIAWWCCSYHSSAITNCCIWSTYTRGFDRWAWSIVRVDVDQQTLRSEAPSPHAISRELEACLSPWEPSLLRSCILSASPWFHRYGQVLQRLFGNWSLHVLSWLWVPGERSAHTVIYMLMIYLISYIKVRYLRCFIVARTFAPDIPPLRHVCTNCLLNDFQLSLGST